MTQIMPNFGTGCSNFARLSFDYPLRSKSVQDAGIKELHAAELCFPCFRPDPCLARKMYRFRINPALDPAELSEKFAVKKRIHIPDFLKLEDAEKLLDYLMGADAWKLVINSDEKIFELDRQTQSDLSKEQQEQLDLAVYAKARNSFQFRYETIRVPDAEVERASRNTLLDDFARFLSEEPVINFLRRILGNSDITYADAQGTAYGPNHFLTTHDDNVAGKNRHAAFVMNLSRNWSPDYGGLLLFHRPGEAEAEAIVPRFNSFNLFAVPQPHSVSMVVPYVPRRRYSVTGWLRSGTKP